MMAEVKAWRLRADDPTKAVAERRRCVDACRPTAPVERPCQFVSGTISPSLKWVKM